MLSWASSPFPRHCLSSCQTSFALCTRYKQPVLDRGRPGYFPLVSLYPALECRALIQQMSPSAFGLNDWDDDEILASVLAVSQQEYLDSMKKNKVHRDPPPDKS